MFLRAGYAAAKRTKHPNLRCSAEIRPAPPPSIPREYLRRTKRALCTSLLPSPPFEFCIDTESEVIALHGHCTGYWRYVFGTLAVRPDRMRSGMYRCEIDTQSTPDLCWLLDALGCPFCRTCRPALAVTRHIHRCRRAHRVHLHRNLCRRAVCQMVQRARARPSWQASTTTSCLNHRRLSPRSYGALLLERCFSRRKHSRQPSWAGIGACPVARLCRPIVRRKRRGLRRTHQLRGICLHRRAIHAFRQARRAQPLVFRPVLMRPSL